MQLRHYLSLEEREEAVLIPAEPTDPVAVGPHGEEITHGLEALLGIEDTRWHLCGSSA